MNRYVLLSMIFFVSQAFSVNSYADEYMNGAKDFTKGFNDGIKQGAKNAVTIQFGNLVNRIYSSYSPLVLDQSELMLDAQLSEIYIKSSQLVQVLTQAEIGKLDVDLTDKKIEELIKEITTMSNSLQRFSWAVRDQMDSLYGAQDWLTQSINGFRQRCELGYIDGLVAPNVGMAERPENFKSDLNVFLGFSNTYGTEGSNSDYVTSNEFSIHAENYGDDSDIRHLQEAAKAVNTANSVVASVALSATVAGAKTVAITNTVSVATGTVAASSLALLGAGAAIAVAIYIVGSYRAYKEQKKWARAEMYKFYNMLDSDDFSKVYRDECVGFSDNLQLVSNVVDKYTNDLVFKEKIDTELSSINYGECRNILDEGDSVKISDEESIKSEDTKTNKKEGDVVVDFRFDETRAEKVFKYYHCVTKVHGPKVFQELVSDKISKTRASLDILRSYLVDLAFMSSKMKNNLPSFFQISEAEIKIDRLHKNMIVSATGVILGLVNFENFEYQKKQLLLAVSEVDKMYLISEKDIMDDISKVEKYVLKYKKVL